MFYIHVEMSLKNYLKVKDVPEFEDFNLELSTGIIGEIKLYNDEANDFLSVVEFLDNKGIEYIGFAGQETREDTSELRLSHAGATIQKTIHNTDYDIVEA